MFIPGAIKLWTQFDLHSGLVQLDLALYLLPYAYRGVVCVRFYDPYEVRSKGFYNLQ